MKVQTHTSSEPPLEYIKAQMPLKIKVGCDLLNQLFSYRNVVQLGTSSRRVIKGRET